jgi:hypothetical protein
MEESMKRKLQQKIEELEVVETRTPEQEDELKKAKRELSNLERESQSEFRAPECRHENADLARGQIL